MQYPDDFLKLRSGPSPKGQADKRALDGVDAPYLTKRSGTTTTRKKDEFSETRSTRGAPSLYGYYSYVTGDFTTYPAAAVDIADGLTVREVKYLQVYRLGPSAPTLPLARTPYAGDGFLLTLLGNGNDVPGNDAVAWPLLLRPTAAVREYQASDPKKDGQTTTFIEQIQIGGLGTAHYLSMLGSGWGGDEKRFRFCLAASYYADANNKFTTRVPIFFTGDTGTQSMQQVSFPFHSGRDTPFCSPYVVGLGKLQSLQVVTEDTDEPMLAPFLATSTDHGSTWASTTADFLTPYLRVIPLDAGDPTATPPRPAVRAHYDNSQLNAIGEYNVNVYLGDGKHILIIPNGFIDMGGSGGTARFAAMAFLGTNGAGYTRLAWPPDSWYVSAGGIPLLEGGDRVRLATYSQDSRSAQRGFGLGCMYISVTKDGAGPFMFTRDFGQTWAFATPTGAPNGFASSGAVIRPYESAEQPGRLVFASPRYGAGDDKGQIDFLVTDGTFTAFKKTAGVIKPKEGVVSPPTSGSAATNLYFTNFGYGDRPYIFPAFPGEFDKP